MSRQALAFLFHRDCLVVRVSILYPKCNQTLHRDCCLCICVTVSVPRFSRGKSGGDSPCIQFCKRGTLCSNTINTVRRLRFVYGHMWTAKSRKRLLPLAERLPCFAMASTGNPSTVRHIPGDVVRLFLHFNTASLFILPPSVSQCSSRPRSEENCLSLAVSVQGEVW